MCFSTTASFSAAAILIPTGAYCVAKAASQAKPYWAFSLLPLLFGVQQALEGLVWLALASQDAMRITLAALGFMAFSHLFWLLWIPAASYVLEPPGLRKRFFLILAVVGALYGASMYIPLLINPHWLTVDVIRHSVVYEAALIYDGYLPRIVVRILYALIVLAALLPSSDRYIRHFGVIIATSVALTTIFYGYAFISVWCYFAALLSLYIVYTILRVTHSDLPGVGRLR